MESPKRQNFKICKMSMERNDTYKNKLVKILKAKTKCKKTSKEKQMLKKKDKVLKNSAKEGNGKKEILLMKKIIGQ